jgi:hypothetical protein
MPSARQQKIDLLKTRAERLVARRIASIFRRTGFLVPNSTWGKKQSVNLAMGDEIFPCGSIDMRGTAWRVIVGNPVHDYEVKNIDPTIQPWAIRCNLNIYSPILRAINPVEQLLRKVENFNDVLGEASEGFSMLSRTEQNQILLPFVISGATPEIANFAIQTGLLPSHPFITGLVEQQVTIEEYPEYKDIPLIWLPALLSKL